jgi:ATP-dependent protease ClpP protease subunit
MSSIVSVQGKIDDLMVANVKSFLKKILANPKEKEVIFEINSEGGNMESMERIKTFMYFMSKWGYKVIGRIIYAESAALLLFLNCSERQLTEESVGVIHMAVLNRKGDQEKLILEREGQASFIARRCNMKISREQVFELEGKKLSCEELIDLGFANKLIKTSILV